MRLLGVRPLILASRSPARAKLLADAGVAFEVRPAAFDEEAAKRELVAGRVGARDLAGRLAVAKARAVRASAGEVVLGADQTLEQDGRFFDKPGSLDGLRAQLTALQGRDHDLHAAAALVRDGEVIWSGVSSVRMAMRSLDAFELDSYIGRDGGEVLDCVGGYRLEGLGVQLFDSIEGEYFAVLGLPLLGVLRALRAMAVRDEQG